MLLPAQVKDNGPTSLVITYECRPENRAAFRAFMETRGIQQFAEWKRQGVFQDYQVFFCSYTAAGVGAFDMAVIMDFAHYTDLTRWKEVERHLPGGLPPEGLQLGVPNRTSFLYPVCHGESASHDSGQGAYVIGLYTSLVDNPEFERYVKGYVDPQLQRWCEAGVLSSYTMYHNHPYQEDLAVIPWTSFLLLRYADMSALADSETAKRNVREQLAGNPAWKTLSEAKNTFRKAKGFVFVDPITAAAPATDHPSQIR